jgi:hypothetical protein
MKEPKAHWARKMLQKVFDDNGGYSTRYGRFPLSYDVSLNSVELEIEELIKLNNITDPEVVEALSSIAGDDWDSEDVYRWALEDAQRGIDDNGTYGMLSPETAIRYGFQYYRKPQYKRVTNENAYYPAKVKGWMVVNPYMLGADVELSLEGRGGKHLCVFKVNGKELTNDVDSYTNEQCRLLLALNCEWEESFNSEAATAEVQYQVNHRFEQLVETVEERIAEAKQAAIDLELAYAGL